MVARVQELDNSFQFCSVSLCYYRQRQLIVEELSNSFNKFMHHVHYSSWNILVIIILRPGGSIFIYESLINIILHIISSLCNLAKRNFFWYRDTQISFKWGNQILFLLLLKPRGRWKFVINLRGDFLKIKVSDLKVFKDLNKFS